VSWSRRYNSRRRVAVLAVAARTTRSLGQNRPLGFYLFGSFNPSRRQIRSPRSLPTRPPAGEARDLAIAITAILAGQCEDGRGERTFVFALCGPVSTNIMRREAAGQCHNSCCSCDHHFKSVGKLHARHQGKPGRSQCLVPDNFLPSTHSKNLA
jgi:hypothetical protein